PAAVIVLCADYRQTPHPHQTTDIMITYDFGAALQNMLLAATELGLGGCPVASFNKPGLIRLLNLPEGVEPKLLVTIGKPKFIPQKPPKKPLEEIFFEETYQGTL
ncbi:MAG: nitroreductase family protein, partial [Bellilinea sp.]|nr:nitroreductase family protein [Bellilinea sp.]